MRKSFLFLLLLVFTACNNEEKTGSNNQNKSTVKEDEADLSAYLDTASTLRIDAVSNAVLYYQQNYFPNTPVSCDSHLVMLKNFSLQVTEDLNMNNVMVEYLNADGEIDWSTERKFNKLGFLVEWSEGYPYFVLDAGYLLNHFSRCLSKPMLVFMSEFEKENQQIALEDGGLKISTDELLRRLLFWDKFLAENKNFILADEARATYNFYLDLYTTGIDNTPAFDPFTGELYPELKTSYSRMIKSNSVSKTTEFMREYYSVLAENNFRMNARVREFIKTKESPY